MTTMRIAGAQIHNVVGDLDGNVRQIADAMQWAEQQGADVLVVPELALTGYPPADLVRHEAFVDEAEAALQQLARQSNRMTSIVSTIDRVPPQRSWDTRDRHIAIAAKLLCGGGVRGTYHKCLLPTYGIFDEGKNIAPGRRPDALWRIGDVIAGVSICEDMWSGDGPPEAQSAAGAQVLLVPNASPYHRGKGASRLRLARQVARRNGLPLVYINFFGGQDDIVFDGGSLVVGGDGELLHRCAEFATDRFCIDVPIAAPRRVTVPVATVHTRPLPAQPAPRRGAPADLPDEWTGVWQALVTATRDFTHKNNFPGAVLGLSGGIDAAVTAAVAAEALGPKQVLGIAMPPEDAPGDEVRDARALAGNLGIDFAVIPMTTVEQSLTAALKPRLGRRTAAETKRDLEAWSRAAILSAFADEQGLLILATGNKSELAIGASPHGDLVGDFAPLRDCPKTLVYEFARRCNRDREVVPKPVLTKQTTAQAFDEGETLPAYDVLDPIVERYLEQAVELEDLVAEGFDPAVVEWVVRRIDDAEFLRRRTPIGVRITATAFDQDRRMPISNAWRPHRRR
ncbi:MAG: NAD+ synthase [Phycisphaeraceae bacterium]